MYYADSKRLTSAGAKKMTKAVARFDFLSEQISREDEELSRLLTMIGLKKQ